MILQELLQLHEAQPLTEGASSYWRLFPGRMTLAGIQRQINGEAKKRVALARKLGELSRDDEAYDHDAQLASVKIRDADRFFASPPAKRKFKQVRDLLEERSEKRGDLLAAKIGEDHKGQKGSFWLVVGWIAS